MRYAFSLVELSIVLVILGLLTGGILAGQSLIRAAEIRSISTDVNRLTTAIHAFRDKYLGYPGDLSSATKFWGARATPAATCQTTASTDALTCDGNGDGQIGGSTSTAYEAFRAWQHLSNAGLLEATVSGVAGSGGTYHCVLGTNCPRSKLSNTGFSVFYYAGVGSSQIINTNSHQLIFGGQHATFWSIQPVLRAEEAWNLDVKMDDGKPGSGKVIGPSNTGRPTCVTSDVAATSEYKLDDTTYGCNLFFVF